MDVREHSEADRDHAAALDDRAARAYREGDFEGAITAWEQLHALHLAAGDRLGAARAATTLAIYLMMDTGLMAPVRGWAARADRLLEGAEECDTHAWLAMAKTYERLLSGDVAMARRWAEVAVDVGARHGTPAPVAIGRVALARLQIFDGHVEEGLRLLDEAAVAIVSGELDSLTIGMVYCELICAMQGLAQYDRAREWTDAMEQWRHGQAFGGINGRCRVHRAEILRLRGSCAEAEEEALHACEELRPWMRREFGWPLTELGTIRLRKGDLGGAEEAFLAAHENGWDPQPGLALLHLARGEVSSASALIRLAIEHPLLVPSKERPPYGRLRLAPLLEAQVEIALAEDDPTTAQRAAAELEEIAATFRSRALQAAACLAKGRVRVAAGESDGAVAACQEAVEGWSEVGAPYETAVARVVLAEAHRASGNPERARMELRAARATFERIGALRLAGLTAGVLDSEAAGPSMPVVAAAAAPADTSARPESCVFRAEGDLRTVAFDGVEVRLRDLKGMRYLARLLAEPGREFHVLDLVAGERRVGPCPPEGDLGPALDATATDAYRRRLRDIEEDIDEATRAGDTHRVALAEADRDYLVTELARAFGLGGRARVEGSTSERARASVTRALRYALARLAEHHPALAAHLELTLHTGTYCSYAPDPRAPIHWTT